MLLLTTAAVFRRRDTAHCFGRRLQDEAVHSAMALFVIYLLLAVAGGILICCIDGIPLMGALFESSSAVATVGLSLGNSKQPFYFLITASVINIILAADFP